MDLIEALHILKDSGSASSLQAEITCLVVGEFYDRKEKYLAAIDRLGLGERVRIVDSYVPNEQVEPYFAAADVVVLPYVSATQSGVVQAAYQFERPVIATSVGGLPEVIDDGRTGLLVPPQDPEALAHAIRRYYEERMEPEFVAAIRRDAGRFSWDRLISTIEELGASP
jgi:glycosyltransferase involved in cell wall biosynthesis